MARRVSIVDDHAEFRARAMLERGGFEVVGEAVDGAKTLTAVSSRDGALDVTAPAARVSER